MFRHLHLTASMWVAKSYTEFKGHSIRKNTVSSTNLQEEYLQIQEWMSLPPGKSLFLGIASFFCPPNDIFDSAVGFFLQAIEKRVLVSVWTSWCSDGLNQFPVEHAMPFKTTMQDCERRESGIKLMNLRPSSPKVGRSLQTYLWVFIILTIISEVWTSQNLPWLTYIYANKCISEEIAVFSSTDRWRM